MPQRKPDVPHLLMKVSCFTSSHVAGASPPCSGSSSQSCFAPESPAGSGPPPSPIQAPALESIQVLHPSKGSTPTSNPSPQSSHRSWPVRQSAPQKALRGEKPKVSLQLPSSLLAFSKCLQFSEQSVQQAGLEMDQATGGLSAKCVLSSPPRFLSSF